MKSPRSLTMWEEICWKWRQGKVVIIGASSPLLFLIDRNQDMYSGWQVLTSLGIFTAWCAVFLAFYACFSGFLIKTTGANISEISPLRTRILSIASSILPLLLLAVIFFPLFMGGLTSSSKYPLISAAVFSFFLFVVGFVFYALAFRLRMILFVFVAISGIHLVYGLLANLVSDLDDRPGKSVTPIAPVEFKTRPNVYLFILESFHSREVLHDVYGHDTNSFSQALVNSGYTLYDPIYANYNATIHSTASIFRMGHNYYKEARGNNDADKETFRILSGINSGLVDTFKANGYSIAYIVSKPYSLHRVDNPKIDYTNLKFDPLYGVVKPILDAKSIMLTSCSPGNAQQWLMSKHQSTVPALVSHIEKSRTGDNRPVFRLIYWLGAQHTDDRIVGAGREEQLKYLESWKKEYPALVTKAEGDILETVRYLNKTDPDGLVVLVGDHGAWLKGCMIRDNRIGPGPSLPEIRARADSLGFTLQDLTKDVSSVFLAIKWPRGAPSQGVRVLSHVNLFRTIFYALSGNEGVLKDEVPNTSFFLVNGHKPMVYVTVKEGIPLDVWEEWKQ